jgi:hypothetical protein
MVCPKNRVTRMRRACAAVSTHSNGETEASLSVVLAETRCYSVGMVPFITPMTIFKSALACAGKRDNSSWCI